MMQCKAKSENLAHILGYQNGAVTGTNLRRCHNTQAWEAIHMITTLEVEVVDMATTRDISLTASLGEYFSSSHFIVLYHSYFVSVSFFQIAKNTKRFYLFFLLVFFWSFALFFLKPKRTKRFSFS